jgi:large subunit ribosomal protein L1
MMKEATSAGAVKAGLEELIEEINKGWLEFDVAVAHPSIMKNLGKIAKTLGQKGLMPNPKAGTVTEKIAETIQDISKGKVEFRADKLGVVHNGFGKVSFSEAQLVENLKTFFKALMDARPAGIKGNYMLNAALATTMGPGIKLDLAKVMEEVKAKK